MAKNKSKKPKTINAEVILEEAKTMKIQSLADKYNVSYFSMYKILKRLGFKGKVGRPKEIFIQDK